jgi:hypothetical protein
MAAAAATCLRASSVFLGDELHSLQRRLIVVLVLVRSLRQLTFSRYLPGRDPLEDVGDAVEPRPLFVVRAQPLPSGGGSRLHRHSHSHRLALQQSVVSTDRDEVRARLRRRSTPPSGSMPPCLLLRAVCRSNPCPPHAGSALRKTTSFPVRHPPAACRPRPRAPRGNPRSCDGLRSNRDRAPRR